MSAKANKVMLQGIYEALGRGERTFFLDALHDDLVMQIMGSSSWSQIVHSKRKFLDVFFGYLASRLSSRSPNTPIRFLADDDWVVVEAKGNMVAVDGRPYQNDYCIHYRIEAGKIVEMREYMDTALCEDRLGTFPDEVKETLQKR